MVLGRSGSVRTGGRVSPHGRFALPSRPISLPSRDKRGRLGEGWREDRGRLDRGRLVHFRGSFGVFSRFFGFAAGFGLFAWWVCPLNSRGVCPLNSRGGLSPKRKGSVPGSCTALPTSAERPTAKPPKLPRRKPPRKNHYGRKNNSSA